MKKHNNSRKKSEQPSKRAKSRGPVQRDTKEVLAELVGKLKEQKRPIQSADRSTATVGGVGQSFLVGLGSKRINDVL